MENNNGISFIGALTLLFICLKLLKVIEWSWLWVLSPIWIGLIFVAILIIIALIVGDL